MHDKYADERLEMASTTDAPARTMAFGIAGLSAVADSLSAIKVCEGQSGQGQDRTCHRLRDGR